MSPPEAQVLHLTGPHCCDAVCAPVQMASYYLVITINSRNHRTALAERSLEMLGKCYLLSFSNQVSIPGVFAQHSNIG